MNETKTSPLTVRDAKIIWYVSQGTSNKQISHILGVKEQTVKNYMFSILRKLGANDRAHAVFITLKHGWLTDVAQTPIAQMLDEG